MTIYTLLAGCCRSAWHTGRPWLRLPWLSSRRRFRGQRRTCWSYTAVSCWSCRVGATTPVYRSCFPNQHSTSALNRTSLSPGLQSNAAAGVPWRELRRRHRRQGYAVLSGRSGHRQTRRKRRQGFFRTWHSTRAVQWPLAGRPAISPSVPWQLI